MSADTKDDVLTVEQARAILDCPLRTLYFWIERGDLQAEPTPPYYQRPRRYIRRAELERFMREGRRSNRVAEEPVAYNAQAS